MAKIYELIQNDDIEAVKKELIKTVYKEGLVNFLSRACIPPLCYVASSEMAKLLIDNGADVNLKFVRNIRSKNDEIHRVEYSVLPHIIMTCRDYVLHSHKELDDYQTEMIIKILSNAGANLNYKIEAPSNDGLLKHQSTILGLTLFYVAPSIFSKSFNVNMIRFLINKGAKIDEIEIKPFLVHTLKVLCCHNLNYIPRERREIFRDLLLILAEKGFFFDCAENTEDLQSPLYFYTIEEIQDKHQKDDIDEIALLKEKHENFVKILKEKVEKFRRNYTSLRLVCKDLRREFNKIANKSREGIVIEENGIKRPKLIKSSGISEDDTTIVGNVVKLISTDLDETQNIQKDQIDNKFTKALEKSRKNNQESRCVIP